MNGFGGNDREQHVIARPATAAERHDATRLLVAAAEHLAQNGVSPELRREVAQERRLVAQGLAGQQAAPWGFGPEPELQHAPGGQLLEGIQHPAFTTVERLFRVLPNDSWTSATRTPENPLTFELGSFKVPSQQIFFVTDYQFSALRQSGVDPFDFVEAAPYRFSGYLGFQIQIGGSDPANVSYQLDPAPQQFQRQSFQGNVPTSIRGASPQQREFNLVQANSFGSVSGAGQSLLPVRPNVQGPRNQPYTRVASPGEQVSLSCTIFRRIMAPLAGIQGIVSGYAIHQNAATALLNRVRPR